MRKFENATILIHSIKSDLELEYPFLAEWQVVFDNSKRRAGLCKMTEKRVSFSRNHIETNSLGVLRDTILHEFAHAIAYVEHRDIGHGVLWKSVAKKIGATPKAKGTYELPTAPWLLVHNCPVTAVIKPVAKRFRRNRKIKNYFLIGKPETMGELFYVKEADFRQFEQGLINKQSLALVQ